MNVFQYLLVVYMGMVCLTLGLGMPSKTRDSRHNSLWASHPNREHGGNRKRQGRLGIKRLRVLQRMLRELQPGDVQWLVRQEKFSSYAGVADTPRRPQTILDSSQQIVDSGEPDESTTDFEEVRPKRFLAVKYTDIECPLAADGVPLFACPSPDVSGEFRCIDDHALCDDRVDCPGGEDEDRTVCMFHKMTMRYLKVLMDSLFGLSRSMRN